MKKGWLQNITNAITGTESEYVPDEVKENIRPYDGRPGTYIGDICVNLKDNTVMVWIPEGEFTMGSSDETIEALLLADPDLISEGFDTEKPQHKVYLNGYWIYKYEVTAIQYREFCRETRRKLPDLPKGTLKAAHPMVNVTWQDAFDYAEWAGVSLPTEAQWEKAARSTDSREYPWGNEWDETKCTNGVKDNYKSSQPVGSNPFDSSPYGCMDMAGNVYEWCIDWYDPGYYANSPKENPSGPPSGPKVVLPFGDTGSARVSRGGSWGSEFSFNMRCANRGYDDPEESSLFTGFRCVKNL
jgi:formylglycine-generating enzyme required for sulfatase activity